MGRYDPKTPSAANSFNLFLALGVAIFGYAACIFVPYYWPLLQLRGMVHATSNAGYKEYNNDKLLQELMRKSATVDLEIELEDFAIEREPMGWDELQKMPAAVRAYARQRGQSITVSFHQSVDAKWPFIDKWTPLELTLSKTTDLSPVEW
jgi:hypothetical protein